MVRRVGTKAFVVSNVAATLLVASAFAACGRSNIDDYELVYPDAGDASIARPDGDASGDASGDRTIDGSDARPDGDATTDAPDGRIDAQPDAPIDARPDRVDGAIDAQPDAPLPDSGGCGPATCPTGCCDGNGRCQLGVGATSCGQFGEKCRDCLGEGFDFCDPRFQACAKTTPVCDATTCPDGCCENFGGTDVCLIGTDPNACGSGGQRCRQCVNQGQVCDAQSRSCVDQPCNSTNCRGCCSNNRCLDGTAQTQCGANGASCQDCGAGTCRPAFVGGFCEGPPPPPCGPRTCPTGCCSNGACIVGTQDDACGRGGLACQDCRTNGNTCQDQRCQTPPPPPCGPATCAFGCCDANGACQAGFIDGRCGSGGNACVDCASRMTTCDIGASPRSCRAATVCPATYGGCADGVKTEAPVRQRVCDASTLQDARVACSAGPDSPTCVAYFQFLTQANAACATCLEPFDVSFTDVAGIFKCISPFVGDRCNIQTGCYVDCETTSCASCASGQEDQCTSEVRGTQCRSFFQASSCIVTGFLGQGSFCNPLNYGSNFGAWFQAVGTRYCGR